MKETDFYDRPVAEKYEELVTVFPNVDPNTVQFRINSDAVKIYCEEECYREIMVSYLPMLPLLEKNVAFEEADYILYMHCYARCHDMSDYVVNQLKLIAEKRKDGAEIIVLGKAANAEKALNGEIENITFWGDHFTEKLGKKFGLDIKEQYFVYDDELEHLAIWPVDGCLQKCKFCRRCYMDIKFESLSLDTIKENLDFLKEHLPNMLKRISLRAENLTEYGIDIYGKQMLHKLIDLIDSYDEVKEIEFPIGLSIGEITPEILDSLCSCNKVTSLSMNLEAGSNRLLKLIGKKHTREQAIDIFKTIRTAHPDVEIRTTVMLGLPTETFEDIWSLAHLIGTVAPNFILCNYYISSPQHPLAQLPQIGDTLRQYHLQLLLNLLCYTASAPFEIRFHSILKKKHSRKWVRLQEKNKELAKYGYLPIHFSCVKTYKKI